MKIQSFVTVLAGLVVAANTYGQGQVTFNNAAASRVLVMETGMPPAQGVAVAGLYYTTDLTALPDPGAAPDAFIYAPPETVITPNQVASFAGLFNGGNRTLPVDSGQRVLIQVRAWSTGYTSYEDAWQRGDSSTLVGESQVVTVTLGGVGGAPIQALSQLLTANIILRPVPEPSTIVLGLLGGLGAMVLLRRRS